MSECRSCRAPIVWAVTSDGKRMPLDAAPIPAGNVVLVGTSVTDHGATPTARVLAAAQDTLFGGMGRPGDTGGPYYQAHWVSCPDADDWRAR